MIEKLTKVQEDHIPEVVAKYVKIGLSTEPIDRVKAEKYAVKLYKFLERGEPLVDFAEGPLEAWKKVLAIHRKENPGETDPDFVWPYLDGQFLAHYSAWVEYLRYIGVDLPDTSIIDDQVEFGPVYALDKVCIFCERMSCCHRDAEGNLHKDGGPAVEYRDGFKLWSLHGVRVPQWLAETPEEKLDAKKFAGIENVEIRREFVRKMGIERLVGKLDAKSLDKANVEIGGKILPYELLEIDLLPPVGKTKCLRMENASLPGVWHLEFVPKEIKTVGEATNWRNQSDLVPEVLT